MTESTSTFGTRWGALRERILNAISSGWEESGELERLPAEISEAVATIAEGLDWELGPGRKKPHSLSISANGDPLKRAAVESYLRGVDDPDFEFYPARQALGADQLERFAFAFDGEELNLDEIRVAWTLDEQSEKLDIVVYHPVLAGLDEDARMRAVFVALDNLLGEDEVTRWLGMIDFADKEPQGSKKLSKLRRQTADLARKATGECWLRGEVEREDGSRVMLTLNAALKPIDYPLMVQHLTLTAALGRAAEKELDELRSGLFEVLGEHAIYAGRELEAERVIEHFRCAYEGPVPALLESVRERYPSMTLDSELDPHWQKVLA